MHLQRRLIIQIDPMAAEQVLFLFGYYYWATDIILEAASKVTPAQFSAVPDPDPGRGGLRGILVHMLDSEIRWRQTVQKLPLTPDLVPADFPDAAALKTRWAVERANWLSFCKGLDDEKLNATYTYQFDNGPVRTRFVWQTIMHVLYHGMQHRSEAAYLLTGYGHSPGDLDFNLYVHQRG